MNKILSFSVDKIFRLDTLSNILHPFNLEFVKRNNVDALHGNGYFYLTYKNEIIYIGASAGRDEIIESRIKKQLETITLRSNRVSFSKEASQTFQQIKNFRGININRKDNGCESSSNKVKFADENWDEFSRLSDHILADFDLYWVELSNLSLAEIESIVNLSKRIINPKCNG